jgi:hypothetical protein
VRKVQLVVLVSLAAFVCCTLPVLADDIPATIGSQHFTNGQIITSAIFFGATSSQHAPFTGPCGSNATTNCNTSWAFSGYVIPAGDTLTGATFTLGIYNLDSSLNPNPFASFTLNGTDDLTLLMNSAADGLDSGAGSKHNEYDVLTIAIPGTFLTDLSGGTATFALTTQGPGFGILGNTKFLGVGLDSSTLDITATPQSGGTVPEPATFSLLGIGLLGLAAAVFRK